MPGRCQVLATVVKSCRLEQAEELPTFLSISFPKEVILDILHTS